MAWAGPLLIAQLGIDTTPFDNWTGSDVRRDVGARLELGLTMPLTEGWLTIAGGNMVGVSSFPSLLLFEVTREMEADGGEVEKLAKVVVVVVAVYLHY